MNCVNMKIKLDHTLYCKKYNKEIKLSDCKNCKLIEYAIKEQTKLKHSKPIKKVSKHHFSVSNTTYNIVFERDKGTCQLCGSQRDLQLHHVVPRSRSKKGINDPNNCIMLCRNCHLDIVHQNIKKYIKILQNIIDEKNNL